MKNVNSLRVAKKNLYEIEVNDAGETIGFNVEDPSLPLRAERAMEEINKIANRCKMEISLIEKQEDKKQKGAIMSSKSRKQLEAYNNMYQDMRLAMDTFLGEGACEKIFGSTNYLTMYDELFEALQPHFDRIGLSVESFKKSIKEKYGKRNEDVLEA